MKHGFSWTIFIFLLILMVFPGCSSTRTAKRALPPPLAQEQVVEMKHQGKSDEEIIKYIDDSHSVFYLTSEDVVRLRERGVSSKLIDYMMETRTRSEIERERRRVEREYSRPRFGVGVGIGHSF